MGWIGTDLDHTLAHYESGDVEKAHVGEPIPKMVERIKAHLAAGYEVRIMTARVSLVGHSQRGVERQQRAIRAWTKKHLGQELRVTCEKDVDMIFLYDDRAVTVEPDTGELLAPEFPLKKRPN